MDNCVHCGKKPKVKYGVFIAKMVSSDKMFKDIFLFHAEKRLKELD